MRLEEGHFLNSRGIPLRYRLALPDAANPKKPLPTVVFAHGFGGSIDSPYIVDSLPHLTGINAAAFCFNFTNPCKNKIDTSKLTPSVALDDMTCAFNFVKQKDNLDAQKIAGIAASFGAYTMMRYAVQDPALLGMILYSSVPDPVKPFRKLLTHAKELLWRMAGTIQQPIEGDMCAIAYRCYRELIRINMAQDVAPNITQNVTFVHGTRDDLASVDDIAAFRNNMTQAQSVDIHVLDGAGHCFAMKPRAGQERSDFEQAIAHTQDALLNLFGAQSSDTTQPSLHEAISLHYRPPSQEYGGFAFAG